MSQPNGSYNSNAEYKELVTFEQVFFPVKPLQSQKLAPLERPLSYEDLFASNTRPGTTTMRGDRIAEMMALFDIQKEPLGVIYKRTIPDQKTSDKDDVFAMYDYYTHKVEFRLVSKLEEYAAAMEKDEKDKKRLKMQKFGKPTQGYRTVKSVIGDVDVLEHVDDHMYNLWKHNSTNVQVVVYYDMSEMDPKNVPDDIFYWLPNPGRQMKGNPLPKPLFVYWMLSDMYLREIDVPDVWETGVYVDGKDAKKKTVKVRIFYDERPKVVIGWKSQGVGGLKDKISIMKKLVDYERRVAYPDYDVATAFPTGNHVTSMEYRMIQDHVDNRPGTINRNDQSLYLLEKQFDDFIDAREWCSVLGKEYLLSVLPEPYNMLYIAIKDDQFVGFAIASYVQSDVVYDNVKYQYYDKRGNVVEDTWTAHNPGVHISALCVRKTASFKGVGTELIRAIKKDAILRTSIPNEKVVHLEAIPEAVEFYKKCRFKRTDPYNTSENMIVEMEWRASDDREFVESIDDEVDGGDEGQMCSIQ